MKKRPGLAKKYCAECGSKRSLIARLTATDNEFCERCYFVLIDLLRNAGADPLKDIN
ncbi:hypothetical protein C7M52_03712 [Mixta theicola]|nr:hypothetical protein C7M52_03712 [Mixta theicola]